MPASCYICNITGPRDAGEYRPELHDCREISCVSSGMPSLNNRYGGCKVVISATTFVFKKKLNQGGRMPATTVFQP